VIGFPLLLTSFLYFRRAKIKEQMTTQETVLDPYGIIYENYREKTFFWEVIAILRRACVVALPLIFTQDLYLSQAYILLAFLFFLLQYLQSPYKNPRENRYEIFCLSLLIVVATLQAGMIDMDSWPVGTQVLMTLSVLPPFIVFAVLFLPRVRLWIKSKTKNDVEISNLEKAPQIQEK